MDVNLTQIFRANRLDAAEIDRLQEVDAAKYSQLNAGVIRGPSLVVADSPFNVSVDELECGNDNPVRDDDLGKMVRLAFDLKPPGVPDFV
jgi:hypothetical protein